MTACAAKFCKSAIWLSVNGSTFWRNAVIAPSSVPSSGALAGNYFGGTAQAAVGIGGGVNVLLGGFDKSIALQPVSVEGDTGLYLGLGIAAMSLTFEEQDPNLETSPPPATE